MRLLPGWPANCRRCRPASCAAACSRMTWCTAARRLSSPPRAGRGRAPAMALACWSSRRPSRSSSGGEYVRRPARCSRSCVARKRFRGLLLAWKAFCYTLGSLVVAVIGMQLWFLSHIIYWNSYNPSATAFMQRYAEQPEAKPVRQRRVPYARISDHLKRAVVAAEDAKFLDHEGFDWEAIQKAMTKNEQRKKVVAGASTISQQLAKNLFLSGQRSWLRKGQEAIITWMMERTLSKRRILELYLNVAEWGEGVFGAEAAARYHFGVSASALGPEQSAYLAAVLPSPRRYDRGRITPYIAGRVDTILVRMAPTQIPWGWPRPKNGWKPRTCSRTCARCRSWCGSPAARRCARSSR